MKKQHAISEQYFERLGLMFQELLKRIEARRKIRTVRTSFLDVGDLSPHIRKDIGIEHEHVRHILR